MLTPAIFCARGTTRRSPLIVIRTGKGLKRSECVRKKTAVALTTGLLLNRAGPGPSAIRHAPSDVIDVSSCETQSPRVR